MKQQNLPQGFSRFSWALAGLCFPIVLWPLALLLSPTLLENPTLTYTQSLAFSCFFWFYPFVLGMIARILFKLHQNRPHFAQKLLVGSAVLFWSCTIYIVMHGLR